MVPPIQKAPLGANATLHFDVVSEFYVSHPWLAGRVQTSFGEELALARLLAYCGLFREEALGPGMFCVVSA